ncbi:MFS transporter [Streptomyces sp. NPDC048281]|uniref:MFS transporter n=1 Tax=Streptomyces sp. NPDC048281 TaxID=3154715 RepID=UPI0034363957
MSRSDVSLRRSRVVLTGYFLGLGVVMAVWGARMPAVQHAAHLTTGSLSLVLLAAAVGMVAGLQAGGRLARPERLPALLIGGAVALTAALAVLGQCRTLASLLAAALAFGATHGVLDVAANTGAVRCQHAYGKPIMSSLHAAYSIGALVGAALAAATAGTAHSTLFLAVGAVLAVGVLAAVPRTLPLSGTDPILLSPHGGRHRTTGSVWLLGALAAASLLGEGAAADWAAVHVHGLHAGTAVAASSFALYSTGMAIGRLTGDRLTTRFGAPAVVRAGAVLAATALATGVLADSVPAALVGWAVFGLGLSGTVPSLITAAGSHGPGAVATVSVTGYLGLLAGPALIGALASITTLPTALLLPALLAAALAALAHRALENTAP